MTSFTDVRNAAKAAPTHSNHGLGSFVTVFVIRLFSVLIRRSTFPIPWGCMGVIRLTLIPASSAHCSHCLDLKQWPLSETTTSGARVAHGNTNWLVMVSLTDGTQADVLTHITSCPFHTKYSIILFNVFVVPI